MKRLFTEIYAALGAPARADERPVVKLQLVGAVIPRLKRARE